jgi:F-type H+-transporting ATPase subunit b
VAALGINLGYLLVQILNFAVLFLVLRAWVFKPIVNLLERRRETLSRSLEDARVAGEVRANAEKEAEGIVSKSQQDAGRIVREATERAEKAALEITTAAEREAQGIRETAASEGEQAKVQTLGELRGQVAMLAVAAAEKLIGEALDDKRQRALIDEFFAGIKGGKVVLLEGESLAGTSAEVTTALPLNPQEQETVRREVLSKLGGASTTSFRVDPKIMGGMVIRVGDKVLDGSVSGKLENLRQSLQ